MADSVSLLQQLDEQLDRFLASWNIYTVLIGLLLAAFLFYPLVLFQDPDVHPFLLARQSSPSPVRQPGESATYRSLESPHGYPLRTGLNVKDADAPKWKAGRDGDIRDVWKQAVRGVVDGDGKPTGEKGRILTVLGKEEIIQFSMTELMQEINVFGEYVKGLEGKTVALFLPNSVELLVGFFAAAFYGFTPVLIPKDQPVEKLIDILQATQSEVLVASAGTIPIEQLSEPSQSLRSIVLVVQRTSRHIDWQASPEETGSKVSVATWHDIIDKKKEVASSDPPSDSPASVTPSTVIVWPSENSKGYDIVEYSQENIVAAIAAQISVLPRLHRLSPSDVLLPLDSLSNIYPLTLTLAALFSNASIALTSVAGPNADYASAFTGISPTIIVASTASMSKANNNKNALANGTWTKVQNSLRARALASGTMPKSSSISNGPRLVYISTRADADSTVLSSAELFSLRMMINARIVYGLVAPKVAGAVTQTNMLDYRKDETPNKSSHFGPPLSSVEVKLVDTPDHKVSDDLVVGEIIASGPAVVGGEAKLGVTGQIRDDNTVSYM